MFLRHLVHSRGCIIVESCYKGELELGNACNDVGISYFSDPTAHISATLGAFGVSLDLLSSSEGSFAGPLRETAD